MTKQILCIKWGNLYGSEYVNRLYAMVRHFTSGDIRFACLTDDKSGIRTEVECYDCPVLDVREPYRNSLWRKIALWQSCENLSGLTGQWLFLDLDIMITSSIDELFTYASDKSFVVMKNDSRNKNKKNSGNTSCFRFDIGSHTYIYDDFMTNTDEILQAHLNEQVYISDHISELAFFPEDWCIRFKRRCVPAWPERFWREPHLPATAKVVAFTGDPNPSEAARGIWKVRRWHEKTHKYIRPATWIDRIWKQVGAE